MDIQVNYKGFDLYVEYNHEVDKGYWYDSNGDGLPPSEYFEITSVEYKGVSVLDLLFEFSESAFNDFENYVYEKISK
jgi:hypothetical protein